MADAADHISSSPINHFHSSSSSGMVEPHTTMADDACIQLQSQPQLQQPHIALPPLVEDLLNQLCNERKQPQPNYVRRKLGLLGEEKALQLLHEIAEAKVIKNLSGFIMWTIRNKPQYQCPSPSPSPSKYAPASLLQTQLSASPFTPSVHKEQPGGDHGGLRPPNSYSSASPSKALRVSPYQGPSYAPPSTITPVRLFKDPLPLPQPSHQGKIKEPSPTQSEIRQIEKVKLKVPAVERVYPDFLFTENLTKAHLGSRAKMSENRKYVEATKMTEASKRRLLMGMKEKKQRWQPKAAPAQAPEAEHEGQNLADRRKQLSVESVLRRVPDDESVPRHGQGVEAASSKASLKRPMTVDLEAETAPKRGRQSEQTRAVIVGEDEEGPAEPINIVCTSKTVQFANHMIFGSQMELSEIDELPRRLIREEAERAFRLQASASMNMWLCMKRAISAAERAKKEYEDSHAKVAEAGKALQDHAHLLNDKQAAERQVKASEAKMAEMRANLEAAVLAMKDAEVAKEAIQVALRESERAKATEIEKAVQEAIRVYRSSKEFTTLVDHEVGLEMADIFYRFKRFNPGQKFNLNFAVDPPPLPKGITEEMIEDYEGDDASEGVVAQVAAAEA